ncbi:DUF2516 family protein [Sinomonas terrae]|uniref:DUF2516 family protein n=1 Tax=Sinomonas terrae TaxID=2908838 RepID=A0ABS9U4L1_9MICC|nr:DUF2516 family protein [Sinomonas terrae]MCH6471622.1 DUF2516 family protein [Sinomonas terrae]
MIASYIVFYSDLIVGYAVSLLCLVISLWAFIDCVTRKGAAFEAGFKRTKGFWLGITGGATLVGILAALSPVSPLFGPSLFTLAAVTAAGIYLADVRPAVSSR